MLFYNLNLVHMLWYYLFELFYLFILQFHFNDFCSFHFIKIYLPWPLKPLHRTDADTSEHWYSVNSCSKWNLHFILFYLQNSKPCCTISLASSEYCVWVSFDHDILSTCLMKTYSQFARFNGIYGVYMYECIEIIKNANNEIPSWDSNPHPLYHMIGSYMRYCTGLYNFNIMRYDWISNIPKIYKYKLTITAQRVKLEYSKFYIHLSANMPVVWIEK